MRLSPVPLLVAVVSVAALAASACRREQRPRTESSPVVAELPAARGAGVPPPASGAVAVDASALTLCVVLEGLEQAKLAPRFGDFADRLRMVVVELPPRADRGLAEEADQLAQTIARARDTRPTRGKPLLLGAGRGGTLALVLAAREPKTLGAVIVVGADWPAGVLPSGPAADAGSPPLRVYVHHGTRDEIVPVAAAGRSSDELALRGLAAVLQLDPRGGHEPTERLIADMRARLGEEARAQRE